MNNKFINKFSWIFIGNVIFALSQWIIIIVITDIGSEYDLGSYTYALAIIAPIFMFFSFDLRRVVATSNRNDKEFITIFLNRLIHLILGLVTICFIILLIDIDSKTMLIIILLTLYKCIEYVSDIIFGYFQQQSAHDLIGKSQFYRGILTILIFTVLFYITNDLIISIVGLNLVMLLRVIFYDLSKFKIMINIDEDYSYFKNLNFIHIIKINLSLGITLLINSLIVNIPRYYIEHFDDLTLVGYFSAIYYILVASNLVISPITTMLAPYLRIKLNQSNSALWHFLLKSSGIIFGCSSLLALILIIFSEWILTLLYNQDFLQYTNVFIVLVISIIFSFTNGLLGLTLITLQMKRIIFFIAIINLFITIIIGYLLVSNYSLIGASYTILVSRISTFILTFLTIYYFIKYKKLD